MGCNTRRRKLWKALSVDAEEMELLFRNAQKAAQERKDITPDEREEWADKTRHVLTVFDRHGIPRPVHSKKSDLPRRSAMAGYAALWDVLARMLYPFGATQAAEEQVLIDRVQMVDALSRLGQLAAAQGKNIELVAMGGAAMVLGYSARLSTHDVDVLIVSPSDAKFVRDLAQSVARERGLPDNWLNDGAKGFLMGTSVGPTVLTKPGLTVRILDPDQLLAMKLSAWRDSRDETDARWLLREISPTAGDREAVWATIELYLLPGKQLKARYAFDELWEGLLHDNN